MSAGSKTVNSVAVLGAGVMGTGIAQLLAQHEIAVSLYDIDPAAVDQAVARVSRSLEKRVAEQKMSPEVAQSALSRITPCRTWEDLGAADAVIEAVQEDPKVKAELFKRAEECFGRDIMFASNTTSCSITTIAAMLAQPERVVGMHFFNPPLVMKLVEIMPGLRTDQEWVTAAVDLAKRLGKHPVVVRRDSTAGVTSRVLGALLNEAVWVLHEGLASVEEIDDALKLGANLPMGPLALIDLIGLDVHLAKTQMLYQKLGDPRYRPCPLLEQMVEAGMLGRKSGRGFHNYG